MISICICGSATRVTPTAVQAGWWAGEGLAQGRDDRGHRIHVEVVGRQLHPVVEPGAGLLEHAFRVPDGLAGLLRIGRTSGPFWSDEVR